MKDAHLSSYGISKYTKRFSLVLGHTLLIMYAVSQDKQEKNKPNYKILTESDNCTGEVLNNKLIEKIALNIHPTQSNVSQQIYLVTNQVL